MHDPNEVSRVVVNAAFGIYTKLGRGLLESVYETVLARDLSRNGLFVERQKWISFDYDGLWFENAFRVDLLVERVVAVEIKSAVALHPQHYKQLLSYLRLMECRLGLLINFGSPTLKDAIKRVANGM